MTESEHYFVEWKEEYVSKERGNRVVHYFLKDSSGESVLAVVGTERSVRHMFYVVAEEFLNAYGAENAVHAGFRWRSRREVVNWLTSMLSKQHRQGDHSKSPQHDPMSRINGHQLQMSDHKSRLARSSKGQLLDIVWSGVAWTCGKQLKHYPAFCRNGITIGVQSFVFVMAEKENRYIAYIEDMYEDRKGQKKVKVRWFHHNREVRGVISLRNPHPHEVFITPYAQVISVECVDGPAIVLTREHYEKCEAVFPHDLLARVHFCFRQFKSNRVKPFKLSQLRGYFEQTFFSCFSPDFFEDEDYSPGDDVKVGSKRTRSSREHRMTGHEQSYQKLKYGLLNVRLNPQKNVEGQLWRAPTIKVDEKIEVLCQDSGVRGCWFRCRVLEVARRQVKIQYNDLKDEDSCDNLEEWIPAFRLAKPDKLGIRYPGRPTIRPALPCDMGGDAFEVGAPVDAWWSDGWWEGVVAGVGNYGNESHQVYIPSENILLNVDRKNLRVSKDWVGDQWMDLEVKPNILSFLAAVVSQDSKLSESNMTKEIKSDKSPTSCPRVPSGNKLDVIEEETNDIAGINPTEEVPSDKDRVDNDPQQEIMEEAKENNETDLDQRDPDCQAISDNAIDNSNNNNDDHDNIIVKDAVSHELPEAGNTCQ